MFITRIYKLRGYSFYNSLAIIHAVLTIPNIRTKIRADITKTENTEKFVTIFHLLLQYITNMGYTYNRNNYIITYFVLLYKNTLHSEMVCF